MRNSKTIGLVGRISTSLSMIISRSIHVAAVDIVSFFFMAGNISVYIYIYIPHFFPFIY